MEKRALPTDSRVQETERKDYMREVYSKYWINARESIYGFQEYDRHLCQYILDRIQQPGKLLEVAIGTGYPFGDFLQHSGYEVHGIDISPRLVEKCLHANPKIHAVVGDAEALPYPDSSFNCSYCFHSTWYFPRVTNALEEMVRVTSPGGLIMFDIQNRNNDHIQHIYRKRLFENKGIGRVVKTAKNVAKLILRRDVPDWHFVMFEVPTFPEEMYAYLGKAPVRSWGMLVRMPDDTLEERKPVGPQQEFQRLVFFATKK
jgi:ubiquinone/menaquinone biosynthesis C-methylase UbiE